MIQQFHSWVFFQKKPPQNTEHYSVIKKNEIMLFVTIWMDLEGVMLNEISHTENDKYCMILLICGV